MEKNVEILKVEAEPRRSIPAIAVTALVMTAALAAIIILQSAVHETTPPQPATQNQAR